MVLISISFTSNRFMYPVDVERIKFLVRSNPADLRLVLVQQLVRARRQNEVNHVDVLLHLLLLVALGALPR